MSGANAGKKRKSFHCILMMSIFFVCGTDFLYAQIEKASNQNDMVELPDESGRPILISKDQYRDQVLPYDIKDSWSDPDKLFATIVFALQKGLIRELDQASQRLLEIDNDSQRSYLLRARFLTSIDKRLQARDILEEYIRKKGPTGPALLDVAKLYASLKQMRKADAALWKSLALDPNNQETLELWVAGHKAVQDSPGYVTALKKAVQIKGGFRPQLYLSANYLKNKDLNTAMKYIAQVLEKSRNLPEFSEVLIALSGNLGENGYLDEMVRIVTPLYIPGKHDPLTGLNLLQAYLEKKDYVSGMHLLNQLDSLNRADIGESIEAYKDKFAQLRLQPRLVPLNARVQVQASPADDQHRLLAVKDDQKKYTPPIILDKPVWYYGLDDPAWLLPKKDQAVSIGFFQFTREAPVPATQAESLARAIPLYLADSLFCQSDVRTYVGILADDARCLVAIQDQASIDSIVDLFKDQKLRFLITGKIRYTGPRCQITLSLWNAQTKTELKSFQRAGAEKAIGGLVSKLENDLLVFCKAKKYIVEKSSVSFYKHVSAKEVPACLDAYDKTFLVNTAVVNRIKKDYVADTGGIVKAILDFALSSGKLQIPRITALSALASLQTLAPEDVQKYKKKIQVFTGERDSKSAFYKLSPVVFQILGMKKELAERKALLLKGADTAYRGWLSKF